MADWLLQCDRLFLVLYLWLISASIIWLSGLSIHPTCRTAREVAGAFRYGSMAKRRNTGWLPVQFISSDPKLNRNPKMLGYVPAPNTARGIRKRTEPLATLTSFIIDALWPHGLPLQRMYARTWSAVQCRGSRGAVNHPL